MTSCRLQVVTPSFLVAEILISSIPGDSLNEENVLIRVVVHILSLAAS